MKAFFAIIAILFTWFSAIAGLMLVSDVSPAALVIVRDERILNRLPEGISLMRGGDNTMVFQSERKDYVAELYEAGALIVFPALRNGCVDLRQLPPKKKVLSGLLLAAERG